MDGGWERRGGWQSIGTDGEPILIEVNLTYGGLSTHLLSNGPLFGDMTPEILKRVYGKRAKWTRIIY